MLTSSAKAKGRRLQQEVCKALLEAGQKFGLVEGDITSRSMGCAGEDAMLSPAARRLYGDLRVECKAVESLNVTGTYFEHAQKYPNKPVVLVHRRNRTQPLCTISLSYFIDLLRAGAQTH